MEEETPSVSDTELESYDTSERPFDFVEADAETVLICEPDSALREKIGIAMKGLGYRTTEAASVKDALKNMRFHVYNIVILNETFDTGDQTGSSVLDYLANLNMSTRRRIFAALISSQFRTLDNMAAFNKSVNLIINASNIDDIGVIIRRGVIDNDAFYHVFKETLHQKGRI